MHYRFRKKAEMARWDSHSWHALALSHRLCLLKKA
jgi:hypothetical protein